MRNGEIRSDARMDLMQNTKPILKTLLGWALALTLPKLALSWLLSEMFPAAAYQQQWETLISGLFALLFAPLGFGIVEQLMGLERDQTPSSQGAMEWMRQSEKRKKAQTMALILFALWLALQGLHQLGYQLTALLFGRGESLAALVNMGESMQPKMFTLGCLAIDFFTDIVQVLAYPAVVLRVMNLEWSALDCLRENWRMVRRNFGRFCGMAAMTTLQLVLFLMLGTVLISLVVLLCMAIFSSWLAELLYLGLTVALALSLALIAAAYELLCMIGLTKTVE